MSAVDTSRTTVTAPFAGQERRFRLRLGEMAELERLTGSGIGACFMRLGSHQFSHRDVWDTIRLGLEGGGTSAAEATALVMRYQDEPLMDFLPLAGQIVSASVNGVPRRDPAGNAQAEGQASAGPATSPSSSAQGPRSAGRRRKSAG